MYKPTHAKSAIAWVIGSMTLLAIVLIGLVAQGESKQSRAIVSYKKTDVSLPRVSVSDTTEDFGTMKVTDEKSATFSFVNTGNKDLQLYGGTTSCGCTFATIEINGNKSPQFSMHSKSNWSAAVPPGGKATVIVVYRPSVMPVKGPVSRSAFIKTNDPENPELAFTVKAVVE